MRIPVLLWLTFLLLVYPVKMNTQVANAIARATPLPTPQDQRSTGPGTQTDQAKKSNAVGVDKKIIDAYLPDTVGPGQKLTISGNFDDVGSWRLVLTKVDEPELRVPPIPGELSADKHRISFDLPNSLKDGRYFAKVELDNGHGTPRPFVLPGELRVSPASELKVTIEKARAKDAYPYPNSDNKFDFEIAGTNFARELVNNHVEVNGIPLTVNCHGCPKTDDPAYPVLIAEPGSETRKLIVHNYTPPGYSNPLEVSVRVGNGDNMAKATDVLMFSSISKPVLQLAAVGAFLLLVATVFVLVQIRNRVRRSSDSKFWSLRAFLIDEDTNSYSLSKFQLTLFTLVTVFGYIYVFVCHLFVQWKFALPPVPTGLPTMLGVSVGTSVVAAGIGARIGGKGAGPESPSFADFVSAGGVVLPERFQFFVWTIVSSAGILALILASDPASITQLPPLPDGMLYLMGISSAGYLGGKLVRGPGPSVRCIDVKRESITEGSENLTVLLVVLNGDNLASDATFQLDEEHIPTEQVTVLDSTPEPGGNPKLCSMLKIRLQKVANRYADGSHTLTVVNSDAQAAVARFGATIESVTKTSVAGDVVTFSVVGANFQDPSSAKWITAAGAVTDLGIAAVTKKRDTDLEVKVPVNLVGADPIEGKLSLVSPGGLITTFDLETRTAVPTPAAVVPPPSAQ